MDFITMLEKLQEDCGVADLKMSDYGIKPEEFEAITMGKLFKFDRIDLSLEDCVDIYKKSYK